jgi:hypothetical protein
VRNSLGFAEVLQREDLCLAAVESSNQQLKTCVVIVNLRLQLHEVRQERLAFAVESGDVPSDWRQVKCFGVLHSLLSDSGLDRIFNLFNRGWPFRWQPRLRVVNDVKNRSDVISCKEHPPILVELTHFGDF